MSSTSPIPALPRWSVPTGLRPRRVPSAPRLAPLFEALVAVADLDIESTSPRLLADETLALFHLVDRLHGLALVRLSRVDRHGVAPREMGTSTASWLRHHTGLASGTASDLVRTGRALHAALPATGSALQSGAITVQHARTIARTARQVEDSTLPEHAGTAVEHVERVMLEVGRAVDAGSLTGFASRVRQVIDPEGTLSDANRAHERRWLSAATTLDGMVSIDGLLDKESGAIVLTALSAAAAPHGADDHRSVQQRRADALVELCGLVLDHGQLGQVGGVRPHLLVTTPADVVGGPGREERRSPQVPEAAWTGPLPRETTRRLACDAEVTRILLSPDSMPLDVGRSTRVVPPHLRHALVVRDRGCVAEGCDRPPAWTEAHHVVHWAEGGRTALDNLVLLCRAHHRKVHDNGWEFRQINNAWRLVPPGDRRSLRPTASSTPDPDPSPQSSSDPRTDEIGDRGGGATEQ